MGQCRADPCVLERIENKEVVLALVVHVDDILVSGNEIVYEELPGIMYDQFSTQNLGELEWYLGWTVERDWEKSYPKDMPVSNG